MPYGALASVYDLLNAGVDYPALADILAGIIDIYSPRRGLLLDLACGTGALSAELSRRGFEVIAADGSPEMLSIAAAREYEGVRPLFLCQQMSELDLYGTVGAAVCTLDSFNHLSGTQELAAVLKRLRLFIEPEGLLIFDMNTPYKHREVLGDNTFILAGGGVRCVWSNRYSPEDCRVDICLDYSDERGILPGGREKFSEFACGDDTVARLLSDSGFELLETRGGYPFDGDAREEVRHLYIARRTAM